MIEIGVQCELGVETLKNAVSTDSKTIEISTSNIHRTKYCKKLGHRLNNNDDLPVKAWKRFHKYKKLRKRFRNVHHSLVVARMQAHLLTKQLTELNKNRPSTLKGDAGENAYDKDIENSPKNLTCPQNTGTYLNISSPIAMYDDITNDSSVIDSDVSSHSMHNNGLEESVVLNNEENASMNSNKKSLNSEYTAIADVAQTTYVAAMKSDDEENDFTEIPHIEIKNEDELIIVDVDQMSDNVFFCSICNESFECINNLDRHMKNHEADTMTDINPMCDELPKEFVDGVDLSMDRTNSMDSDNDQIQLHTTAKHISRCNTYRYERLSINSKVESRSRSRSYNRDTPEKRRRSPSPSLSHERCIIYIGNLDNSYTEANLSTIFEKYGRVRNISLHFKRNPPNKGYAFITFFNPKDAHTVVDTKHVDPVLRNMAISFGGRRSFCTEQYRDLDNIDSYTPYNQPNSQADTKSDPFEKLLKSFSYSLKRKKNTNNC